MLRRKLTTLQIIVHAGAWVPLVWLVWAYTSGNLTVNPIQAATQHSGKFALIFLLLSLAVTPIHTLFGLRQVIQVRRALGLYAFIYAAIHVLIFAGLDYGFDWSLLTQAVVEKRYILVGLGALVILSALAATSFKSWMKRLGKKWKRLHRLVYVAAGLVIVHYSWSIKGDLLRLQGDIWQPLSFGSVVLVLLILRLPPLRRWISSARSRLSRSRRLAGLQARRNAQSANPPGLAAELDHPR